ncbi:MCE family protein [Mycobacterium celatum]|uniref:MCE family protein n=2 Tax=Mycobacterium celatum TaxID=28045 RepID=A0A1X1RPJ0_MYCCE|nr:MlaD family protein [Mycobacterium celatum]ORV10870.1 mammalian cell entry protein [Mycobacterium celatum]PIB79474.1 MCE family protein [Mycobacterium celatum]
MLTRFVRVQLTIFVVVSIIGVVLMIFSYMQVPTLLGIGRITVTLELPAAGGLYRFSNVTYRGVQVGKVTAVGLTPNGAKATLSLGTSPKIPADLSAEVRSISAVGEQYVDLRPHTDSPPYLRDGSVIPAGKTAIPQPVGPMLDQTTKLIDSIPKDRLSTLLDESFKGFNGSAYDLGSLFDSSARVAADANAVSDRTRTLTEDTVPLLDSQAQTADSIRQWARSLAGVSEQVATDDAQVRTLLQNGPGTADEAARLLEQVKPTLPVLLANLTTIGQIGVTYHPSLEQLLVLLPPAIAGLQAAQPINNYTGLPVGGFHVSVADPPACTVGFLPPSQWRSPADTTTVDTPDGLYCKLPQDSPLAVRGARNYPCMGHPGKRAPTVEICNSDKPYEPLAMRQHMAGPYPLDPNLVSQGIPPDDRINFHDFEYGPPEGTPLPPPTALPPPPALPARPPLGPLPPGNAAGAPPPGPATYAAGPPWLAPPANPASPSGPQGNPASPPPGPQVNPESPSPLGPLAPLDTADSAAPVPARPAPAPGGMPSAAPSSFGAKGSGNGPSVAIASYNPRTGSYVGTDGHLYRQSDLVTPSDHKAKTWKDLLLTQT